MTTPTIPPEPARLGARLIDAWRLCRTLQAEYRACAELLQIALDMVREKDQEIDHLRAHYHRALDDCRELRQALRACQERRAA